MPILYDIGVCGHVCGHICMSASKTKLTVKSYFSNNWNKKLSGVTIIDVTNGTKWKWLEKVLQYKIET